MSSSSERPCSATSATQIAAAARIPAGVEAAMLLTAEPRARERMRTLELGGAHRAPTGELQPLDLERARSGGDDEPRTGLDHRAGRCSDRSRHGLRFPDAQLSPRPRCLRDRSRVEGAHLAVERLGVARPVDRGLATLDLARIA